MLKTKLAAAFIAAMPLALQPAPLSPTPTQSAPPPTSDLRELQFPAIPCVDGVCLIREKDLDLIQLINASLAAKVAQCIPLPPGRKT